MLRKHERNSIETSFLIRMNRIRDDVDVEMPDVEI